MMLWLLLHVSYCKIQVLSPDVTKDQFNDEGIVGNISYSISDFGRIPFN